MRMLRLAAALVTVGVVGRGDVNAALGELSEARHLASGHRPVGGVGSLGKATCSRRRGDDDDRVADESR